MLCQWEDPDPPRKFKCKNCGKGRGRGNITVLPYNRRCSATEIRRGECEHVGEKLRLQKCESCGGTVRLKVFGCALHQECTLRKSIPGLKCCQTCPDHSEVGKTAATFDA